MNKNRPGKRKISHFVKWIVGEQNSFLAPDPKRPQTMTARPVASGNFLMCRMPISRGLHGCSNKSSYFTGYCNHAKFVSCFSFASFKGHPALLFCRTLSDFAHQSNGPIGDQIVAR